MFSSTPLLPELPDDLTSKVAADVPLLSDIEVTSLCHVKGEGEFRKHLNIGNETTFLDTELRNKMSNFLAVLPALKVMEDQILHDVEGREVDATTKKKRQTAEEKTSHATRKGVIHWLLGHDVNDLRLLFPAVIVPGEQSLQK